MVQYEYPNAFFFNSQFKTVLLALKGHIRLFYPFVFVKCHCQEIAFTFIWRSQKAACFNRRFIYLTRKTTKLASLLWGLNVLL